VTTSEDYKEKCAFFASKCKQHLRRAELSRSLALRGIESEALLPPDVEALARESLGGEKAMEREKLVALVTKTSFLLLKVEFEFFLARMARCVWESFFLALIHDKKQKALTDKHELREFAHAAARGSATEYVVRKMVPSHGLARLLKVLRESTSVDLRGLLYKASRRHWPQIHSAFEVRHLIEHANGTVHEEFLSQVASEDDWKNSTWGALALAAGQQIQIRDEDFGATLEAMLAAVDALTSALADFHPSSR
jgi:hypothetical protein